MLVAIPHNLLCILKAKAGKLDIKTQGPSIIFISLQVASKMYLSATST